MGRVIDIEIHSLEQIPFVSVDSQGNIVMKMITEQSKKKKEKEKTNASDDT
jgi:hypothetical protein